MRVVQSPEGDRNGRRLGPNQYQYYVQLTTNDSSLSLPRAFLEEGAEWCKVSSSVANEDNIDYGGFQFYSIFQSEGLFSLN